MSTARADNDYMQLVSAFPLIPLRTEKQFDEAIKVMKGVARRMASLSQGEADYLSVLGGLIQDYEAKLPRLDEKLSPQDALKYLMEVNGLAQTDLVEFVGHKSNLSAFLSGQRGLSKRAAANLAEYFKVSPGIFLPND